MRTLTWLVCAPALAKRLKSPDDLRDATLLRVAHAEDEWPTWFKAAGFPKLRARGPEFEYYGQALQAAADTNPTVLNTRVKELRAAGLVTHDENGYRLTQAGSELMTLLLPLHAWAESKIQRRR